jgi:thiol-disulfide isomerase/thioredoxin
MNRSSLILASIGAVLVVLTVGLTTVHMRHAVMVAHAGPVAETSGSSSGTVIKFAAQPEDAPPILVNDLSGAPVSSAAFPGKVTLLSFWATWCPPCRLEIPELIELQERYKDKLQIVGISMDDADTAAEVQQVKDFAAKMGINYPVVMATPTLVEQYGGVPALPTTFVLNRDGRVVQKHTGLYSLEDFDNEVRSLAGLPVDAKIETFEDTGQIFLKNAAKATELPGVDFSGLSPEQKREALKRMNSENCTCGCGLTIAECRMNDSTCDVSEGMAAKIIKEVAAGTPARHATTQAQQPKS